MVGASKDINFWGTFDGNGHTLTLNYNTTESYTAPFRYVRAATIKNLHVDGTIETSGQYAAGFCGRVYKTTITNCRSSVVIRSSRSGWGGHGGFVALKPNTTGIALVIEGCVFDGKILSVGEQATTACGGFVGYSSYSSITIKDCLYAPAPLGEGETAVSNSYTFAQLGVDPHFTLTNSYYTLPLGTEQGKLAYHITGGTGVTVTHTDTATDYDLSGLTSYGTGL